MTINRPASHKPAPWRTGAAVLAAAATAALALATVPTLAASAAPASAPRPGISSVSFSGTHGPGVASPTITVTGSRFGTAPPGTSDNTTSCGPYTANGKVYGSKLYFTDDANFEAGFSSAGSGADCVGIIVVSWSATKVVLQLGNAYGTFAHWYLTNGDGFAISIKSAIWGGTVSGLS